MHCKHWKYLYCHVLDVTVASHVTLKTIIPSSIYYSNDYSMYDKVHCSLCIDNCICTVYKGWPNLTKRSNYLLILCALVSIISSNSLNYERQYSRKPISSMLKPEDSTSIDWNGINKRLKVVANCFFFEIFLVFYAPLYGLRGTSRAFGEGIHSGGSICTVSNNGTYSR